jgi:restriction system protein
MAIPYHQTLMLPLLKLARDGKRHSLEEAFEHLATEFGLTKEEQERTAVDGYPVFEGRVVQAYGHLAGAGLLDIPREGVFRITKGGLDVLAEKPRKISNKYLWQLPSLSRLR